MCAGDDQVEDRPAQAEAALLSGKTTHDLGAPSHFLQGPFQEVRAAESAPQAEWIAPMGAHGGQVIG